MYTASSTAPLRSHCVLAAAPPSSDNIGFKSTLLHLPPLSSPTVSEDARGRIQDCFDQLEIRILLGLPDPDPLVRGTDPDVDPSFFS
jgi:hypothetical protein